MRILHVFRTPVGGLFRHVRDLARGQQARGHAVGILCDSTTGGEGAARLLATAEAYCALGITRIPISRLPGLGDLSGIRQTIAHARNTRPDIIHCHGAKGGVYGRLAAWHLGLPSAYTPHGGSLHYRWASPSGAVFLAAEWALARLGGGLSFVCDYEKTAFDAKIGLGRNPWRVTHNGLWPEEFTAIAPAADAADVVFIGEMRHLKGVDVLISALGLCARQRRVTACLVGDGPELAAFQAQAKAAALDGLVSFAGRLPAADAFRRGRIFVMPSRAESFPYVILEACAAGLPIIASAVGGVAEALPAPRMVPPGDAEALATAILQALSAPEQLAARAAEDQASARARFTADAMVAGVLSLYGAAGAI
jgi:glycosyltransferase involved in cell wall biosynthesis